MAVAISNAKYTGKKDPLILRASLRNPDLIFLRKKSSQNELSRKIIRDHPCSPDIINGCSPYHDHVIDNRIIGQNNHYQLQFDQNSIKSSLKTHEPHFHGLENGDCLFHGPWICHNIWSDIIHDLWIFHGIWSNTIHDPWKTFLWPWKSLECRIVGFHGAWIPHEIKCDIIHDQ